MTASDTVPPTNDFDPPAIAARIEGILAERGWSQRELARRSQMNPSQLSNLLRALREGKGVGLATLRKIALGIGKGLPWLLMGVRKHAFNSSTIPDARALIQDLEDKEEIAREASFSHEASPPYEGDSVLEMALFGAMDPKVSSARDFDAARAAIRESRPCREFIDGLDATELQGFAATILASARWLRTSGEELSPARIMLHASLLGLLDRLGHAPPEGPSAAR